MKLGKVAFFAMVGLTGCGADDGARAEVAAPASGGESGNAGAGGSGESGAAGDGGTAGTGASGTAGTGASGASGAAGAGGASGAAGTGGTAGSGAPTLSPDESAALANVNANLERLRALRVVEVKGLVVDQPGQTGFCYGPCPEDRAREALRLQKLASVAEFAVEVQYVAGSCIERVDSNLTALRALQIVELGAFLRTQPANNPLCYNTPCPEDIDAAAAENEARAADLESIAISARPL